MTIINLDTITLAKGAHDDFESGSCLLEATAYLANEPFSDHPACVSPVLGAYGRSLNDVLPDDRRQELKQYIPRLIGTANDGQDEARSYIALDWLIRTYTPAFLDLAGLTAEAQELRNLRRIVDPIAAKEAWPVVRGARQKASAAWAAARAAVGDAAGVAAGAAARDAARDAAWAAVGVAAGDAAWDAAGVAAGDAARVAAGDAAWAAARDALNPTVDTLQTSAIALLGVMIDPSGVGR